MDLTQVRTLSDRHSLLHESCGASGTAAITSEHFSLRASDGSLTAFSTGRKSEPLGYEYYCLERFGSYEEGDDDQTPPSMELKAIVCVPEKENSVIDGVIIPILFIVRITSESRVILSRELSLRT